MSELSELLKARNYKIRVCAVEGVDEYWHKGEVHVVIAYGKNTGKGWKGRDPSTVTTVGRRGRTVVLVGNGSCKLKKALEKMEGLKFGPDQNLRTHL